MQDLGGEGWARTLAGWHSLAIRRYTPPDDDNNNGDNGHTGNHRRLAMGGRRGEGGMRARNDGGVMESEVAVGKRRASSQRQGGLQ